MAVRNEENTQRRNVSGTIHKSRPEVLTWCSTETRCCGNEKNCWSREFNL